MSSSPLHLFLWASPRVSHATALYLHSWIIESTKNAVDFKWLQPTETHMLNSKCTRYRYNLSLPICTCDNLFQKTIHIYDVWYTLRFGPVNWFHFYLSHLYHNDASTNAEFIREQRHLPPNPATIADLKDPPDLVILG